MSTITKPMALDESFKTTETTPRNIADVLAEMGEAIAQGMGRHANEVAYDNTTSGLLADDVQEAVDELAEEKVDKVTGKGLSTNDYTDAEKNKLEGIEAGAQVNPTIDSELSDSSTNAVQNKVVKGALDGKADNADVAGTQSVSGNPITLTDASETYAQSLVVELEPIQEGSGDPSPTNVRLITGYTECNVDDVGFNQWDEEWELGSIDVTTGENISGTTWSRSKNYINVIPNTAYYYKHDAINMGIRYYDALKRYIGYEASSSTSGEKTTPANCRYVRITWNKSTYDNDICINISKPTGTPKNGDYVPYHSSNATIQFGQTVYGGRSNFTDGGTESNENKVTIDDASKISMVVSQLFMISKTNFPNGLFDADSIIGLYCDRLKVMVTDQSQNIIYRNANGMVIRTSEEYESASAFLTAMGGEIDIAYRLATPDTISTPPTDLKLLKGTNNISTNGTTINLDYIPNNSIGDAVKASEEYTDRAVNDAMPISGTATVTLLHEEDQGEDWIVGFTGEINGQFDTDHFDYYLTARYTHAYNTNTQILNMDNCTDGDYVQIWQTGAFDFSVDGGVTVDISVTPTKMTFTINCIGDSIFGIYSSSETTGEVKYLITPARKG